MPATKYLEEQFVVKVLEKNEALPTTTKLYVGLAKKGTKLLVSTSEVEECAWTSYARVLAKGGSNKAPGAGESSEPMEWEAPEVVIPAPTGAVSQGVAEFVFICDALSGTANIWFYAKLTAKATIEYPTTTEVKFAAKELKVTVL